MNKNNKIMLGIVVFLLVTTAVGAVYNRQYAREKEALLKAAEIAVLVDGKEVSRLNMASLAKLPTEHFTARLKSSLMSKPEEHTYTGIAFSALFAAAGVSLENRSRVVVRSVDGYAVPLTIKEIREMSNVYLVYMDNGEYLGAYGEKDAQGPYMIVIRGDRFSQRWAKYVCEIDLQT